MKRIGTIKNGVVVLSAGEGLPEGSIVEVLPLEKAASLPPDSEPPTLHELLRPLIGIVDDMPPDLAANHDHYLYGLPKR